ncbi:FAD-binding monooxygenase [Streptomyces viridochromogenes]|uniref:FAD-binding monooxygenase n=1 Tax=Streptomyces viridochromogenes TaxID=1938 RepID=A0A0J7ZDJ2_STRVR|nr:FAD-dependent monooxygenase [Streptomyces viridochromogenes]KMS73909.1 FAD-binding monooxygenase [Streptomyces viridochromogenes]KOG10980.1 FAD-binding monooxygenase [Streptomyces viridochromogenes]KOG26083.1 FAD-binding monooxygenase [Streptomyces viridochromogenes]
MRVKVACIGGGPAGLYLSILLKLRDPSHDITVYERNPEGSTYGWGVTYWRGLLDRLCEHDPVSARVIEENSVRWSEGVAHVRGRTTRRPGDAGYGIGRHRLLEILAERARSLGVRLEYEQEITPGNLPAADLVVASDGVHSALRTRYADHFGTETKAGRNRFIWLGTSKAFDAFTFSFVESGHGWIWCYGYGFGPDAGTFVVECAPETWTGLGLDTASEADALAVLEKVFAGVLDGHPLMGRSGVDGKAQWQTFRTLTNRTWYRGNLVLLGDAAHTTHYSIGAGTTLAVEDAAALAGALHEHAALPQALAHYQQHRQQALLSIQSAAHYSARWYENLPRYIHLPPQQMFALLGQRHSPLLPHVPPQLYYRLDRAAGQSEAWRRLKHWVGLKVARTVHARALASGR